MEIPRDAFATVRSLADGFPVVAVTGPRQSGKTTLVQAAFPDRPYANLEDLETNELATSDPKGFLASFPDGAILDEVQRAPELFSQLQVRVDAERRPGLFVLTGSQQFDLMARVTQSLAGRIALVPLLPFGLSELVRANRAPKQLEDLLWMGLYPPVHDRGLDPRIWYGNYVQTYLERDLRQQIAIRDLSTFQRFLRMCAARSGQLLNLSSLANDCGVTHNTARAWISVLEAGFLVHLLRPHHASFGKRLVKTPKLYFNDPGLAAWLLGIENAKQLSTHSQRGALFETWLVADLLKARFNMGLSSNLYFWRNRSGLEVDVLAERGELLVAVEAKSGQTISDDYFRSLERWHALAADQRGSSWLVYGGSSTQRRREVQVLSWSDISPLVEAIVGDVEH
jgi:predicted AAA+ superfamily ATPase